MINVTQTYIQHRHKLFGPCSGKKDLMHLFCTLYGASHHNNLIINNRRNHDDDCSFVKQKRDQPKAKGCDADQPERTGQRFADDLSPLCLSMVNMRLRAKYTLGYWSGGVELVPDCRQILVVLGSHWSGYMTVNVAVIDRKLLKRHRKRQLVSCLI